MSRRPFVVVFSSALPRPPSAAEPLTPPVGVPGRPTGRPGPQPGPGPGPACWGTCRASSDPGSLGGVRAGPGRGPGPGPVPGPGRALGRLALRGFRRQAGGGGCGASRLRDAGLRPHCSHPHGSLCRCVCFALVCLLSRRACAGFSEPAGGGRAASTPSRGSLGALWRRAALGCAGLRPPFFFAPSSALAWTGPGPSASSPAGAAGRD